MSFVKRLDSYMSSINGAQKPTLNCLYLALFIQECITLCVRAKLFVMLFYTQPSLNYNIVIFIPKSKLYSGIRLIICLHCLWNIYELPSCKSWSRRDETGQLPRMAGLIRHPKEAHAFLPLDTPCLNFLLVCNTYYQPVV